METIKTTQMSESFLVGALLAAAGGFLDAYTYLTRGHVFANAQTGNMVMLGISLSEKQFGKVFFYLLPILAFGFGIILTEIIRLKYKETAAVHWRQIILFAEMLLLITASFIPQGKSDSIVNISISFLCAMQVEGFRKINGNAIATTMCTGNLRTATELIFQFFLSKDNKIKNKSMQYYAVILFFIFGAVLGGLLTSVFHIKSVLFCCILLAAAFIAMFARDKQTPAAGI